MQSAAERLAKVKAVREAADGEIVCHLRQLRERLGLSLRDVGAAADVSHEAVGLWERGRCRPVLGTAYRVAEFFGVSVYDIWPEPVAKERKAK